MIVFEELPCHHCGRVLPVFNPETMKRKNYFGEGIEEKDLCVHLTTDPFDDEIRQDYTLYWLCQECEYYSAMEI